MNLKASILGCQNNLQGESTQMGARCQQDEEAQIALREQDYKERPDSAAKWIAKLDEEVRRLQSLVVSGKNGLGT